MALAKPSSNKKKAPAKAGLKGLLAGLKKRVAPKAEGKASKKAGRGGKEALPSKKAPPAPKLPPQTAAPKVASKKKAGEKRDLAQETAPSGRGKPAKGGKTAREAGPNKMLLGSRPAGYMNEAGEAVCREVACEGLATTGGYCRTHYIKNWKKIKRKELILKEKKLNQYIEELVAKYPDKYIEAIRQDLASDKDFAKVISDLDLDESIDDFDMDSDSVDSFIDNIRRDFDDEGEGF